MKGLGIDIVDVKRIKRLIKTHANNKLQKIFSKKELKMNLESLAVRFAFKEAFLKALGLGVFNTNIKLSDIEVLNKTNGEPKLVLNKNINKVLKLKKIKKVFFSLSHEKDKAIAVVVLL